MHHLRDTDCSAGAGNVDDDRILDEWRRLLGQNAEVSVRASARRGGNDEFDRLRERDRCRAQQQRRDKAANKFHGEVSSVLRLFVRVGNAPSNPNKLAGVSTRMMRRAASLGTQSTSPCTQSQYVTSSSCDTNGQSLAHTSCCGPPASSSAST